MSDAPTSTGIGQPVRRKEDQRLLTGRGRYSDDLNLPGQAYAAMLRSPHAHARIRAIDVSAALKVPGVVAVYTGADLEADGVGPIAPDYNFMGTIEQQREMPDVVLVNRDGSDMFASPYHLLVRDRARFNGQSVAMVVAETVGAAKDGADAIEVDYEPLDSVTVTRDAAKPDAPRLWDAAPSNVCLDSEHGDAAAVAAAFEKAKHVARLSTWISRVTGVPMEPRTGVGEYDAATQRYTLHAGSGGVHRQKRELSMILNIPLESVRVVTHDIGGNFGTKNSLFPEFPLVVWASKRLGRPVKWTCERSEAFLSDYQGRDLAADVELALDAEGNFLALRGDMLSNLGAHAASIVPLRKGVSIITGLYRVPVIHIHARAVLSNTPSTIPYRSAGRPEAMYLIERLIEIAARDFGFDAIELRRRNIIPPKALPYRNASGVTYDSGEYEKGMDIALHLGDRKGFAARRAEAKQRGKLRGFGFSNYIELTMGFPREWGEVTVKPEGVVEVAVGTLASGQGHETSFTQCVSEWLGVPFEKVNLIQGDTDRIPVGGGSHSGRSMRMAGFVMGKATDAVIARGKRITAHILEVAAADIEFSGGDFSVKGTDRKQSIFEVAKAALTRADLPADLRGPLAAAHEQLFKDGGYPYGGQVCEVEIDPDTGVVQIVRHAAVDDVGRAVNPLILHGQTHGAIVQGAGQIMGEQCNYDPETGQLLSGSFMDYAMPRADQYPSFDTELMEVPSPSNPLGVRAGGEGGTTPALASVTNAIVDALVEFGVKHIEMPATPERVWRAIAGK